MRCFALRQTLCGSSLVLCAFILLVTAAVTAAAQTSGQWTWMGGSNALPASNQGVAPVYGTLNQGAAGNTPGGRDGYASWTDLSGNFWIFGGDAYNPATSSYSRFNDLWERSVSTGYWIWKGGSSSVGTNCYTNNSRTVCGQSGIFGSSQTAAGNMPGGRHNAASWIDSAGNLWLFGGEGFDGAGHYGYLNDMWEYSPSTGAWAWLSGNQHLSGSGMYGIAGVYGTFGAAATSNTPGSRASANTWTDATGNFWLFGGAPVFDSKGASFYLSDMWMFNPTTKLWTWMGGPKIIASTSSYTAGTYGELGVPSPYSLPGDRSGAATWTDTNGNLWLFGGTLYFEDPNPDNRWVNDLWEFNTASGWWMWMGGSSTLPPANSGNAASYGSQGVTAVSNIPGGRSFSYTWRDASGNFWLLGGQGVDASGSVGGLNDLWVFQPQAYVWTWMGGSNTVGSTCGSLGGSYVCGKESVYGSLGVAAAGNTPGGRGAGSGWTDSSGNLWLYGGEGVDGAGNIGYLNDLWKLNTPSVSVPAPAPTPSISPTPGTYTSAPSVTISDSISNAIFYYTTDGTQPTTASTVYVGAFQVSTSQTIKAIATAPGYSPSGTATATYTINLPQAATPIFSPSGGSFPTSQAVTIGTTTPNATIYYTIDGSTPGPSNPTTNIYTGAITVFSSETIEAIAVADGYANSAAASATFSIVGPPIQGKWIWMGGSNAGNQNGVYGTQGTPAAGNMPGARWGAVTWTDASGNLWLFGGNGSDANGNSGYLNDFWKYAPSTGAWTWVSGSKIWNQPGVYGTRGVTAASNTPGARYYAASWSDANGNLWLFGGYGLDPSGYAGYLNDLWKYTLSTGEWTWMRGDSTKNQTGAYGTPGEPAADNLPGGRAGSVSWTDASGNLWLLGGNGYDAGGNQDRLNDLWKYTLSTGEWTWMDGSRSVDQLGVYGTLGVPSAANQPGARDSAVGWMDPSGNLWRFGGWGVYAYFGGFAAFDPFNDLWRYSPSAGNWTWMSGSNGINAVGVYGTQGTSSTGNVPGARYNPTSWSDANGNLWLFGGTGYGAAYGSLNDLWAYMPATGQWTWMGGSSAPNQVGVYGTLGVAAAANAPGARRNAASWTDSIGNLWLFGGTGDDANGTVGNLNDLWVYQMVQPAAATPIISPNGGAFTSWTPVTIGDATPGATIYYTTDGSTPTTSSAVYSGSITVLSTETVQALAVAAGYTNSAVASATFTLNMPVAAMPTISPASGSYSSAQTVTIGDTTPGATIYYTTDGTTPTTNSPVYTTPFYYCSMPQTFKAIAVAGGYAGSAVGSASYTFSPVVSGQWTWLAGSATAGTTTSGISAVYGTEGTPSASAYPGSKESPSSWTDKNGNFWLFGGFGGWSNELWEFNWNTRQWTWAGGGGSDEAVYGTQGTPSASNIPGYRMETGNTTDPSGNLWLFGGWGQSSTNFGYMNDLWRYNPQNNQWTWMAGSSTVPAFQGGQPATYGQKGIPANGNTPGAREDPAMWADASGNIWLFGGFGYDANGRLGNFNDLWKFDSVAMQWAWMEGNNTANGQDVKGTQGVPSTGNIPSARSVATSWTDLNGKFWLFGGTGADDALWKFDPNTLAWMVVDGNNSSFSAYGREGVPSPANLPGPRSDASGWVDQSGDLWMFGGSSNASSPGQLFLNELWEYNPNLNEWVWWGGFANSASCVTVNSATYCGQTGSYGSQGTPASGNFPGARWGVANWADPSGKLWLFGGFGSDSVGTFGLLNDFWQYQTASPNWQAPSPAFNPPGGNYNSNLSVALTDFAPAATIYYTTDGSTPTTGSSVYNGPIPVGSTETIQAMAVLSGYPNSQVVSETYTIPSQAALPIISPNSGTYTIGPIVTITDSTPNATIYYTTNGSTPSTGSLVYSGSITVVSSETIRAIAVAIGYVNSPIASASFTVNPPAAAAPTISPNSGWFSSPVSVTIADSTAGAAIYYTLDGSMPSQASLLYNGSFTVSSSAVVQAMAVATNYTASPVSSASYLVAGSQARFIYNFAGTGQYGETGDGGPATAADLYYGEGMVLDAAGNLFYADTTNNRIRRVDAGSGIVTTYAGTGVAGYSGDGARAIDAQLSYPWGLALDGAGNLYVADQGNNAIRVISAQSGQIATVTTQVNSPTGIALDKSGNLYAAGEYGGIYKVTLPLGVATQIGGGSNYGAYSGNGGLAVNATLGIVTGLALDASGNIYFADAYNNLILKIDAATNTIGTVAGNGSTGRYSGDGGPATSAGLYSPFDLAFDAAGSLYITDGLAIRKISNGTISMYAGSPSSAGTGDGGVAVPNPVGAWDSIAAGPDGSIYYFDWDLIRIRRITARIATPSGQTPAPVITLAQGTYPTPQTVTLSAQQGATIYLTFDGTTPTVGSPIYHGPITVSGSTMLQAIALAPGYLPSGIALAGYAIGAAPVSVVDTVVNLKSVSPSNVSTCWGNTVRDSANNLYLIQNCNSQVWKISAQTGAATLIAGNGNYNYGGDNGPATAASFRFSQNSGIALDPSGAIYVADTYNHRIRRIDLTTGIVTSVAGTGGSGYSGDGGQSAQAQIGYPAGIAVTAAGTYGYVVDDYACVVRKIDTSTGVITTVAGAAYDCGYSGDGGQATAAYLNTPRSLTLDASGNIYIGEAADIRLVSAQTGTIATLAGTGSYGLQGDGGPASKATVVPNSLATDSAGNLYFSTDSEVRRVATGTGIVTTVAGNGYRFAWGDGDPPNNDGFNTPFGIAIDSHGNLLIVDSPNQKVREVAPAIAAPTFSPAAGQYTAAQPVMIGDTSSGVAIYYATDGSSPNPNWPAYTGPIMVNSSEAVQAVAVIPSYQGYLASPVSSATYTIGKFTPAINWATPQPIGYGATLASILNATASYNSAPVAGSFVYTATPIGGTTSAVTSATVLGAGSYTLTATFTATDTTDYASGGAATVPLTVNGATPAINWATPQPIGYGTTLASILNATAIYNSSPVAGSLTYTATPLGGTASAVTSATVLGAGSYTLAATFTPTDIADYVSGGTATVPLTVNPGPPVSLLIQGLPATANVGQPITVAITALDAGGNRTRGDNDTVTITSTDQNATLPASVTLQQGAASFSVSFGTPGVQHITVTDSPAGIAATSQGVTVGILDFVVNTVIDDAGNSALCTPQSAAGINATDTACSLRDALLATTAAYSGNITFDAQAFASPQTIVLGNAGTMGIPPFTTISGPTTSSGGAAVNRVTVIGGGGYEMFTAYGGTSTIANLNIGSVSSPVSGGAISNDAGLTITGVVFSGNSYAFGGAIWNGGALTIDRSIFSANSAEVAGGAILNEGILTIANSVFSGNSTSFEGGAIESDTETMTIVNTTFSGNSAERGGAIFNDTSANISNCTFFGNSVSGQGGDGGGAIFHDQIGMLSIVNSTFAGNTATNAYGGAIDSSGPLSVSNNIFAGNTAVTGGGIFNFALNGGSIAAERNNVFYNNAGGDALHFDPASTDVTGADSKLAALGNYGGATQTMMPLPGSAAICAGTTTSRGLALPTADQRGKSLDSQCPAGALDAGAVQTNYSLTFSSEPSDVARSAIMTPAPGVTLSESGAPFADGTDSITIPMTLTTGSGVVSGGAAATSPTTAIASYSSLSIDTAGPGDVLTALLTLNAASTPPVTVSAVSNPFTVSAAAPTIKWPTPQPIPYGATLGSILTATATYNSSTVPGSFAYTARSIGGTANAVTSATVLAAGSYTLTAMFTPSDTTNYLSGGTATVPLTVNQAASSVNWATPQPIAYGTALDSAQLDATASVPGTFSYTPAAGTVLPAGTQTLNVTFTPTDTTDYNTATGSVSITVNKATMTGTAAAAPSTLGYGSADSVTLSAAIPASGSGAAASGTVTFRIGAATLGSCALSSGACSTSYTPSYATLVAAANTVTASYPGDSNYTSTSATATITISKATPVVTLTSSSNPSTYGTGVTFTASLAAVGSGVVPSGTVSFLIGAAPLCNAVTLSGGSATCLFSGLSAGSASITVTYGGDTNYTTAASTALTQNVNKANSSIATNPTASSVTYGQALSASTLSGGAGTPAGGSFTWTTPTAIPAAGAPAESITYTPTDTTDYNTATGSVSITVNKATVTVSTWPTATAITYGQTLASSTLKGGVASVPGSFAFTLPGTAPNAGPYSASVTFTPNDITDYSTVVGSVNVTVNQAPQGITFAALVSPVPLGTPAVSLSATGGSSGNPVVFSILSGPGSIGSGQLSYTGIGTVVVAADQAGNANFTAAPEVTQSVQVNPARLSLSATQLSFGSQPVGTTSLDQTLILTNNYAFPVAMTGIQAAGDFGISANCAAVPALGTCSVNVHFAPIATGARTGALTISNAGSNTTQTVSLSGTGIAADIQISPANLTFGSQVVNTSSTAQTVTILNTGTTNLLVSNVTASGDYRSSGNCGDVPAGSNCNLLVQFLPTATGVRTGAIVLTDNAGGSSGQTQTVTLSGVGTQAGVTLSPNTQTFPSTPLGTASFAQNIVLTSTGSAPVTAIAVFVLGDFQQTNNCPATLNPQISCTISVSYAPTIGGAETGTLVVTDSLGTQPASLQGYGQVAGAQLSAGQLIFGGQLVNTNSLAQTVILTNSGNGPMTNGAIQMPPNFSSTTNCTGTLPAGSDCSINVIFSPATTGPLNGAVTITDNAGTQSFTVQGQGVSPGLAVTPSFVSFGAQAVGTASQAQTLKIANSGTVALTLNPISVSTNFLESDQCSGTLQPGASCLASVSFAPAATGNMTGSLTIGDATGLVSTIVAASGEGALPGIATSPAMLSFGGQIVGVISQSQTVTVSNAGDAPLPIGSITASGDFDEVDNCSEQTVAPASYCVINVTMTPTTAGARTGAVEIVNSVDGAHLVALSGMGLAGNLVVSPTSLAFGSSSVVAVGLAPNAPGVAQNVVLTNTGNAAFQFGPFGLLGDFYESDNCGSSLAAGSRCTVTVKFVPTALYHRTGALTIADSTGANAQTVMLQGDGSPAGLIVSPSVLSFGTEHVGVTSAVHTSTLTNNTGLDIPHLSITASGEYNESDNCPSTLPNGSSCTISVSVTPVLPGMVTGTLTISAGAEIVSGQAVGGRAHPLLLAFADGSQANATALALGDDTNMADVGSIATQTTATSAPDKPVATLVFGIAPAATLTVGGNAGTSVTVIEQDANGDEVAASDLITLCVTGPAGYTATYMATAIGGMATFNLSGTALKRAGTYTYAASTVPATIAQASASEAVVAGPASIVTASAGATQSATILAAFPTPLQVTVTDAFGNPVAGTAASFGVPGSGASAVLSSSTATTNSDGIASVTATANGTAGTYSVTAGAHSATPATFTLTTRRHSPRSHGLRPRQSFTVRL